MKKNKKQQTLIIRSVSFQQLDKNIIAIAEKFPGHLYLLTHVHGMLSAMKYSQLKGAIPYESRRNFSFFYMPPVFRFPAFDNTIIPVTNLSGKGFLNVFLLAFRIRTKHIFICNLNSEIRPLSRLSILQKALVSLFTSIISLILTLPALIISPFALALALLRKKPKIR
jgi:hypothetical protein